MTRRTKILIYLAITIVLIGIIVICLSGKPSGISINDFSQMIASGDCAVSNNESGELTIIYDQTSDCSVDLFLERPVELKHNRELNFNFLVNDIVERGQVKLGVFAAGWQTLLDGAGNLGTGLTQVKLELPDDQTNEVSVVRLIFYRTAFINPATIHLQSINAVPLTAKPAWQTWLNQAGLYLGSAVVLGGVGLKNLTHYWLAGGQISYLARILCGLGSLLAAWLSAWIITRRGLKIVGLANALMAASLICIFQITVIMVGLSLVKEMFALPVIVANVAILVILTLCYRAWPSLAVLARVSAAVITRLKRHWLIVLIFGLVGTLYLVAVMQGISEPPVGYDSLVYHLPMAVEWSKTGQLLPLSFPTFLGYMPGGAELLMAFNLMTWQSDMYVSIIQFPFLLLTALAVYQIGRTLGARRLAAAIGAALVFAVPVFVKEIQRSYVDIIFMALVMITLAYALKYWRQPTWVNLALGAMAAGLAAGVRFTAFHFLLPVLIFFLLGFIFARQTQPVRRRLWPVVKKIGAFVLIAVIAGGYWYIRNWIITGNPIYPSPLHLGGVTIFPSGISPSYANFLGGMTIWPNLWHFDLAPYREAILQSFGWPLIISAGVIVVVAFIGTIIIKSPWREKLLKIFLICLPLYALFIYTTIPFSAHVNQALRYFFVALPLVAVAAVIIASWHKIAAYLVAGLIIGLTVYSFWPTAAWDPNTTVNFPVSACLLLATALVVSWLIWGALRIPGILRLGHWGYYLIAGLVMIGLVGAMSGFMQDYEGYKFSWYGDKYSQIGQAAEWINQHTTGDNIDLVRLDRVYPFYGDNFKNNLYQLSLNSTAVKLYHDYQLPFKEDWTGYDQLNLTVDLEPADRQPHDYRADLTLFTTDDKNNYVALGNSRYDLVPGENNLFFDLRPIISRNRVVIWWWHVADQSFTASAKLAIRRIYLSNRNELGKSLPDTMAIVPNTWELSGAWQNTNNVYYVMTDQEYLLQSEYQYGRDDLGNGGDIKAYFNTDEFGHMHESPNRAAWLASLANHQIKYVVASGINNEHLVPELTWINELPARLTEVFSNDLIKIVEVNNPN